MKKLFVVMIAILILLSACSTEKKEASTQANGKVEIDFWYGLGSEAHVKMQEIIKKYNESQDRYVVNGVSQASYSETYQKLQAAIASGQAPAVFITGSDVVADLGRKKALADLTPFIEKDENFQEDDYLDVFTQQAKVEDRWFGLPAYGTTQVMYYRKDFYEQAGVDPKEAFSSWEKLAEAAKQLQTQTDVQFGHLPMWGEGNLIDIALSNGGTIISEDGQEVLIDQPEWIEAWEFIRKQIHDEKTMKVHSGGQGWEYWYRTIDEVMNGTAAGYTGSSGDKGDLDFTKIASAPQPGLNGHPAKPIVTSLYMSVPEIVSDEEKEAAYDFMTYFSSAEVNAEWAQAIGYIPVKKSSMEVPSYVSFLEENPHYAVPFEQAQTGSSSFIDPTGGKINDAIKIAADKVELQNIDAETALKEAKKVAQEALEQIK